MQKRRGPHKRPDTKITFRITHEDHGLGRAGAMGHRPVPGTFVERAAEIQAAGYYRKTLPRMTVRLVPPTQMLLPSLVMVSRPPRPRTVPWLTV